jgi:hypothetical protein
VTSAELPVGMWCWPGPRAAAGVQEGPAGDPLLAVFLDPVNLVLTVPPFPDGPVMMAGFLRELARAAVRLAQDLQPEPEGRRSGAHRVLGDGHGSEVRRW